MGRLDHVHIRVPDRAAAADWYAKHLGFEPVEAFIAFARSLPGEIKGPLGTPLVLSDLIDFDLCWAFDLADPWGNQYELNCYEYDRIKNQLVDAADVSPVRYWPVERRRRYVGDADSGTVV